MYLYTVPMRRWFLVLMLIVLPLQFTSAVAASYCRHETSGLVRHFGHHEHRHEATSDSKSGASSLVSDLEQSAGLGDPDCEYCHLGGGVSFAASAIGIAVPLPTALYAPPHVSRYRSYVPFGPERPDRAESTTAARFRGGVGFGHMFG